MIVLRRRTLWERIARLWAPYRRRSDARLRAAIELLVADPSLPCCVDGILIPHGYGLGSGPRRRHDL